MSSTGVFHSRRCGTMADAGFWAFILGAFVIHPPKPTQLQAESLFRADRKLAALEDPRRASRTRRPKMSFVPLYPSNEWRNAGPQNNVPTPLSEQSEEPSMTLC